MYWYVKRFIDIILSLIGLVVLSPIFLTTAIVIKLESPGPIFFIQERAGFNKQSFRMYKFRTMYIDSPTDSPTWMLPNADDYITRIGHIIRKRSIDELPQLINILKGDMSIIGPRPVVWAEKELINKRYDKGAYNALPGLTGLAQINGRDLVTIEDKAKIDAVYVKNMSFKYDLKIFINTIFYVTKREDIVEGIRSSIDRDNEKKKINSSVIVQEEKYK